MNKTKISKTISYILRHNPESFGLKLAADASVETDKLLDSLKDKFKGISRENLRELVKNDPKGRFSFLNEGDRIRANYGHSIDGVNPDYESVKPPKFLFHGTTPKVKAKILSEGIKPMGRNFVHLSVNIEEAEKVARRRTNKPVKLKLMALKAYKDGQNFYKTAEDIYLTDEIAGEYLFIS